MERALKITIFLLFFGILCRTLLADFESEKAIQILSLTKYGSVDGPYDLNLNILRPILEADDIKDRHVSVISINGAIRTGKSLMLNFYLRYLYAQVCFKHTFFRSYRHTSASLSISSVFLKLSVQET